MFISTEIETVETVDMNTIGGADVTLSTAFTEADPSNHTRMCFVIIFCSSSGTHTLYALYCPLEQLSLNSTNVTGKSHAAFEKSVL